MDSNFLFSIKDYPEIYQRNLGLDNCDIHSYSKMKELCDKFNKIIDTHLKLNRGTEAFSARLQQRATAKLFRHILAQVYSRAVTDPDKLRDYEPFSPSVKPSSHLFFPFEYYFLQVYGETSPDLIDSILKTIHLTEDQTFIDLGSGVGNVVLHVAALANCKHVYGIEHEETPATYACAMADEFRFWMRWYGKCYSEFQLEHGDFLTHSKIDERIKEADVIFANNYVFGSTVNHELKVKFMNMKGKKNL
jgi:H3 lysine-79-specific histone-lysine N-methyltransferase